MPLDGVRRMFRDSGVSAEQGNLLQGPGRKNSECVSALLHLRYRCSATAS